MNEGGIGMLFRVFKQLDVRNRAYVIDNQGNKVFYGTVYQCGKFIEYMIGGNDNDRTNCSDLEERKASHLLDR